MTLVPPPILTLLIAYVSLNRVLSGAIIMAYLVCGLFFLRFWRRTHDRLFVIFAVAFWVLAVNRTLAVTGAEEHELRSLTYYTVRLVAFLLILVAVIDKNRSTRLPPSGPEQTQKL